LSEIKCEFFSARNLFLKFLDFASILMFSVQFKLVVYKVSKFRMLKLPFNVFLVKYLLHGNFYRSFTPQN
jgi:hypothetical protein